MNNRINQGYTLMEVLVALLVAAIIGAAVVALALQAQSATTTASQNNLYTNQAEGLMERVVSFRNSCPWINFAQNGAYVGVNFTACTLTPAGSPLPANCSRGLGYPVCFDIQDGLGTTKRTNVYVYYSDRGNQKTVTLSRYFSQLK